MGKKPKSQKGNSPNSTSLSSGGHALAALGPKTEAAVVGISKDSSSQGPLFASGDDDLIQIAKALQETNWKDDAAAEAVAAYAETVRQGRTLDVSSVCRWLRSHPNAPTAVKDCMSVSPPDDISIIKEMPRTGSQKLVFLAYWRVPQRQVVLKRITGPPELQKLILEREASVHPLSIQHPNIIETHLLLNRSGEPFLVEEFLRRVLNDQWRSAGIHEATNLLFDVANALRYLHENMKSIHGDVKPDNIGKREDNYVLLDFGIYREIDKFTPDVSATGSLRTRAPELLERNKYVSPTKADVWALGATVYSTLAGRFPLLDAGEPVPRLSSGEVREKFEAGLVSRIENEWDKRVDLTAIPSPLRGVLERALKKDPTARCTASELCDAVEKELTAYLRRGSTAGRFSLMQELDQFESHLPTGESLKTMPLAIRDSWQSHLNQIKQASGLTPDSQQRIDSLIARLS